MSEKFNFENGDIVMIRKEVRLQHLRNYPFGIIVEQVGGKRPDGSKNVSVHVYDKEGRLYIDSENHFIPGYIDYNTKELVPYKKAKELGYKELVSSPTKAVLLMEKD